MLSNIIVIKRGIDTSKQTKQASTKEDKDKHEPIFIPADTEEAASVSTGSIAIEGFIMVSSY